MKGANTMREGKDEFGLLSPNFPFDFAVAFSRGLVLVIMVCFFENTGNTDYAKRHCKYSSPETRSQYAREGKYEKNNIRPMFNHQLGKHGNG